jgi:hypothetical protein
MAFRLPGLAPLVQYRTDYNPCVSTDPGRDCTHRAIQEWPAGAATPGFLLHLVELDDQGQLFDRGQLDAVLAHIRHVSATHDFLAVVFVHGWKHNAKEGDDNLDHFRQVLARLAATEHALSAAQAIAPRRVIGLFLGWRGLSVSAPLAVELTFWDRKNTAQKVGHGGVTEVLSRLEVIRRDRTAGTDRSRLVVVGHSFGGAVVYTALGQILESRFLAAGAADAGPDAKGFGDLVVLVNPAFEALLYASLSDASTARAAYAKSQLPVLAILTSEKDTATGFWFPLGRWFSTWFEQHRSQKRFNPVTGKKEPIAERSADIRSVGHFDPYKTHYLRAAADTSADEVERRTPEQRVHSVMSAGAGWEDDAPGSRIAFPGSVLERTATSAGRNPYLNIRVDGALIPSHDAIWDPRVETFLGHLILVSGQSRDLTERGEQRRRALNAP